MNTQQKIQASLETWHDILARNAMEELDPILSDKIVFRSPVAHNPYPGRAAIKLVLKTVNTVFKDFEYHRTLFTEDGMSVVLEFSANVDDKRVKGIDFLRFDAEGKIEEFEVMMRPLSGLNALARNMGEKLAPFMDQLTQK
ncbi:nuclear transport factor 2 family protein [Comamonas composti]|uniref:nuclear transport factor 2 family protein n=1 Tax=Comamonas composti TaxID=408558 RepID=UPI00041108AE|nr:nuclear transport factor 2 family protein [Comamonas composti]